MGRVALWQPFGKRDCTAETVQNTARAEESIASIADSLAVWATSLT